MFYPEIVELVFKYDDLQIDISKFIHTSGFSTDEFTEPFTGYVDEIVGFAKDLDDIRAVYFCSDELELHPEVGKITFVDKQLETGKIIVKELKHSSLLVAFICTAGGSLDRKAKEATQEGNPVLGYLYDCFGSYLVENVGNKLQDCVRVEAEKSGMKITNRYSPGYCEWLVDEQHKLFSLFPAANCGVTLSASALMDPIKSISGILGVGERVKFRENRCGICKLAHCVNRQR